MQVLVEILDDLQLGAYEVKMGRLHSPACRCAGVFGCMDGVGKLSRQTRCCTLHACLGGLPGSTCYCSSTPMLLLFLRSMRSLFQPLQSRSS